MITASDLPEILYSLELDDLTGIGKGMLARLNAQGISTVEQLYDLSSGMRCADMICRNLKAYVVRLVTRMCYLHNIVLSKVPVP